MPRPLPAWSRLLLTIALLLPTVLPALAVSTPTETPALPAASALTSVSASPFTSPLPPPPVPAARLALTLHAAPAWAEPGEVVTFTVTAANTGTAPLAGLTLTDTLPDGLVYVARSAVGFEYSAQNKRLTWQPPSLAAGMTITGSFQARAQGLAIGATVTNTVSATAQVLTGPASASTGVDIVSPRNNEVWIMSGQGGLLRSTDDRVVLRVPAGAVKGRVRFTYAPQADVPKPPPGLRFAFRLEAAEEGATPVRQFPVPLLLSIASGSQDVVGAGLVYYDEPVQQWRVIPARRLPPGQLLQARLEHFTLFALLSEDPVMPSGIPNIRGIQSDLFTGAATINYAIPLPPGAGGFAPRLTLQFNSRDRADSSGATSVLGTGWSLSVDSWVATGWFLAGSTTNKPTIWRIDGVSYTEQGGTFREASDWRISVSGTGWQQLRAAYTPDGRHYHFEPAFVDVKDTDRFVTAKWLLFWVSDAAGNKVFYFYAWPLPIDPANVESPDYAKYKARIKTITVPTGNDPDGTTEVLLYSSFDAGEALFYLYQNPLTGIAYNFGPDPSAVQQTQVEFRYDPPARTDFPGRGSSDPCGPDSDDAKGKQYFYTDRLLRGIYVKQLRVDRSGYDMHTAYKLDYDHWGNPECRRSQRYALKSVARCSGYANANWTGCLPAMSFTNAEQGDDQSGWLSVADNGYGGRVGFAHTSSYGWAVTAKTVSDATTLQADMWNSSYSGEVHNADGVTVGFTDVTETLPASLGSGNTNTHHFKPGDDDANSGLRGKEDPQTIRSNGVLQQEVERIWQTTPAYTGGNLAYLAQEDQRLYNSDGLSYQARRTKYYYDPYWQNYCGGGGQFGNATRIEEYANTTDPTPYRTTLKGYCPNLTAWIMPKPAFSNVYNGAVPAPPAVPDAAAIADATWYIYADDQDNPDPAWNRVIGSKGQLRGVRRYAGKDTAGNLLFVDTRYRHDAFGNPTHATVYANYGSGSAWASAAPRTAVTTYDPTRHVYPLSKTLPPTTDGLQFTTSYKYYALNADPGGFGLFGQLQSATDPNGATTRYTYDAWGRLQKVIQPGDSEDQPTIYHAYYDDVFNVRLPFLHATWRKTEQNAAPFSSGSTWVREFYDGLGQLIETQTPSQDWTPAGAGQDVVRFSKYNALGLQTSEAMPYLKPAYVYTPNCQGSGRPCNPYTAADASQPKTQYTYDGLGRTKTITQPDNTRLEHWYGVADGLRYDDIVAANRHRKQYRYDALNRLVRVYEISGDCGNYWGYTCGGAFNTPWAVYTLTQYGYNTRDQLTDVWDGATPGNHIGLGYDLLGRKTSMSDPDMGAWSYAYDTAGNLTRQTDAKNQRFCFY